MEQTSPVRLSPTATAVDLILKNDGRDGVVDLVRNLRTIDGLSYRAIAYRVTDLTGMSVTHESIRIWMQDWDRGVAA